MLILIIILSIFAIIGIYFFVSKRIHATKEKKINSAYELNDVGLGLLNKGNYTEAKNYFRSAVDIHPMEYTFYYNEAVAEANLENFEESIKLFRKALYFKPDLYEAYLNMGVIYFGRNQFKNAKQKFEAVISINPKSEKAYFFLGKIYMIISCIKL